MKTRGFSITEVVFALVLISIIGITLLGVIPAAIRATKQAGHRATATRLGESTIEDLAHSSAAVGLQPVTNVTLNGTDFELQGEIQLATPDVAVLSTNNANSNPSTISNLNPQDARIITVRIRWVESPNQTHTLVTRRQIFVSH